MIWICTLCLLFIAAWLLFNGLNERRWVHSHSHDETVANDEGLLMGLSNLTRSGKPVGDGKLSIDEENSGFARAVSKVRTSTSKYGDKFIESRAAAARMDDDDYGHPAATQDDDTFFGRAVSKVGAQSARMEKRLGEKMQSASASGKSVFGPNEQGESVVARVSKKVTAASNELSQRVAKGAGDLSQNLAEKRQSASKNDVIGSVTARFSSDREKAKDALSGSSGGSGTDEDMVSRISKKVGSSMEKMEDKLTKKTSPSDS